MNREWQLLPYAEGSGQQHMDFDNHLLDCHSRDPAYPSVLRFYRWTPPAISLGFHQKTYPDRWQAIAAIHNLDIVHRPSGGRAVLHWGDLTYAIVTDAGGGGTARSRQIYEHLCGFLIQGFAALGLELGYGKAGRGYIHNPSCFSTATNADLVIADGRKLIGSAQVYRRNSVLQHGSIAIAPNHDLLREIFGAPVPIVGYQELITEVHESNNSMNDIIANIMTALTQAARQHFQTQLL